MTLRFENIKLGTRIRAYDFQPRKELGARYIEGEIKKIVDEPYYAFVINVEVDTTSNRVGKNVLVPMEISVMDYTDRITILEN